MTKTQLGLWNRGPSKFSAIFCHFARKRAEKTDLQHLKLSLLCLLTGDESPNATPHAFSHVHKPGVGHQAFLDNVHGTVELLTFLLQLESLLIDWPVPGDVLDEVLEDLAGDGEPACPGLQQSTWEMENAPMFYIFCGLNNSAKVWGWNHTCL